MAISCVPTNKKHKEGFLDHIGLAKQCRKLTSNGNPRVVTLAETTIKLCEEKQREKQKLSLWDFSMKLQNMAMLKWYEEDRIPPIGELTKQWVPAISEMTVIATDYLEDSKVNPTALAEQCKEELCNCDDPKVVILAEAIIKLCEEKQREKQELSFSDFSSKLQDVAKLKSHEEGAILAIRKYEKQWGPAISEMTVIAADYLGGPKVHRTALAKRCNEELSKSNDLKMVTLAGEVAKLCLTRKKDKRQLRLPGLQTRIQNIAITNSLESAEENKEWMTAITEIENIVLEYIKK